MKRRLLVFLLALPLCAADLKYTVIVTRHGVRSPLWSASRLRQFSAEPWPDWGVPPGHLTPHGREAILKMGAYYRQWLNLKDCGRVTIYADTDQRTMETGRAFSEALQPGCGVPVDFHRGSKSDPLFAETLKSYSESLRLRFHAELVAQHKGSFDALQYVLGSSKVMVAPFAEGPTLAEDFLLEYADGMQGKDLGWGRLTKENLFRILEIHATSADLPRRTPSIAQSALKLWHCVRQSIEQAASGNRVQGALGKPGDVLLLISGHDSNISDLSALLHTSWQLPGYQPNDTPPGGALIFSLWQNAEGQQTITLRYVAQSLEQMRNLDGGQPESQDVMIPGCEPCTWTGFQKMEGRIK